jgi:signal peptidase I
MRLMREYTESLIVAICLALVLRFFVISAYKIPTGSMLPTLKVGDFIFAYKLPYGFPVPFSNGQRWGSTLPQRGDVVVFRYPGNENVNYVKRVVGLPGDQIAIKNKKLVIKGIEVK